ncbi:MAG: hypothetical protein WDO69_11975 [Pseudomonadota bacterium]
MSNKTRFLTIVLGATALASLTYGVTRRGWQRRSAPPLASQALSSGERNAPAAADVPPLTAPDWETLSVHSVRGSTPEPLDLAMNLDGVFDGQSEDGLVLTVRPSDRVPPPRSGDDEEAPSADDLGLAWLTHATEAEHSLSESDLTPEIEDIALTEEPDSDEADSNEDAAVEPDEHEDFRRTRA